jgi:manganese/iron transport system ATP-binding protein
MYPHIPHQHNQPILDLRAVNLRYDGHLALENITFHLHGGERVAVVGPNGAGKSTLLKLVAGVLRPTDGDVTVYGSGPSGHVCIGYIPQRSQVDWRFPVNVADVVMMGRIAKLGLFGWPKKRDWDYVRAAIESVGITDLYSRQIGELSGGQQQRMFIARALAQEAELMLMDEPLTGLDTPSQEGLLALLGKLQEKGVTVMLATHDLEQAAQFFDRILLLNHKIIAFGPAAQVLQPEKLLEAYGGKLHLNGNGQMLMDDCCHDE